MIGKAQRKLAPRPRFSQLFTSAFRGGCEDRARKVQSIAIAIKTKELRTILF
jgi:hypothetical protein